MALAAEALLGRKVPERATWLRTVLCEMSRAMAALSHLMGAATLPGVGVPAAHVAGAQAREAWQFALERMSGGRVHPMITRIGGLAHDAPPNWTDDVRRAIDLTAEELPILMRIVESTAHQVALDAGSTDTTPIARLTYDDAVAYGVGGPVARASGLDLDLRRDAPLLAYPLLQDVVTIAVDTAGDAMTRYRILGEQVGLDLHLLNTCLDRLPDGEVNVQLPKVVRAPEGISYARLESATGVNGVLLVSTGETTPWRVRLRTASYANVQSMTAAMPGTPLGALPPGPQQCFGIGIKLRILSEHLMGCPRGLDDGATGGTKIATFTLDRMHAGHVRENAGEETQVKSMLSHAKGPMAEFVEREVF